VQVLDVAELTVAAGEIVGLLGENGAGKSTLVNVLAGTVSPDSGVVEVDGAGLPLGSPTAAAHAGVALVSQEFPLVGQLSVAENLFLGIRPAGSSRVLVDRRALNEQAQTVLDELGLPIRARQRLDRLSVAQRQLVEIAKAWHRSPRLLILDEPTSALGPVEAETVLELARAHAAAGGAVVFIGHRFDEVFALCSRLVVLRNGQVVADLPTAEASEELVVRHMVGRQLAEHPPLAAVDRTVQPCLRVDDLAADGLGPVSLTVNRGEVVGVAGLMGAGRSRLLHTVFGAQPATGGTMALGGEPYRPRSARDGIAAGVVLVPEDRKQQSLLPDASIRWNVTLAVLPRLARGPLLRPRHDRDSAARTIELTQIRCRGAEQPIRELSGGNQQRAVLGRAVATEPSLLLLDEPTRGVDVGAKAGIYTLIAESAERGSAVLVVSSELEELLRICHRVVVLARGRLVAEFDRAHFDKETIVAHAAGLAAAPQGAR
jgi:ABC-type sugar transport system ATPase subunit